MVPIPGDLQGSGIDAASHTDIAAQSAAELGRTTSESDLVNSHQVAPGDEPLLRAAGHAEDAQAVLSPADPNSQPVHAQSLPQVIETSNGDLQSHQCSAALLQGPPASVAGAAAEAGEVLLAGVVTNGSYHLAHQAATEAVCAGSKKKCATEPLAEPRLLNTAAYSQVAGNDVEEGTPSCMLSDDHYQALAPHLGSGEEKTCQAQVNCESHGADCPVQEGAVTVLEGTGLLGLDSYGDTDSDN